MSCARRLDPAARFHWRAYVAGAQSGGWPRVARSQAVGIAGSCSRWPGCHTLTGMEPG